MGRLLGLLQSRMPNTTPIHCRRRGRILRDEIWRKLLGEHGELGAVLVHADVRAAHPPLAVERRTAV